MSEDLRLFLRYVIPSMASMLIAGSFCIVDTIFIGQGMGETGLAALGISWPVVMLLWSIGELIGSGAAVLIAQARGAQEPFTAQRLFTNMIWLQFVAAVFCMIPALLWLRPILAFLGTTETLMPISVEYATIMIWAMLIGNLMMSGVAVLRNDGQPLLAMWMEIVGLLMNILLDWIFIIVLHQGAAGAAYATIFSQCAASLIALVYFLSPKTDLHFSWACFLPDWGLIKQIFVSGIPIFGNSFAILVMLSLHNFQAMKYGGEEGLAAYTLLSGLEALGSLLMTGLAIGIQPMAAFLHGAKMHQKKAHIGRMGIESSLVIGLLLCIFSLCLRDLMPGWTGLSGSTAQLAARGVLISAPAFLLLGVIRVASFYYQATDQLVKSSILIYGDGCFALPLCLFLLPLWLGMDGVWSAMPCSRVILFLLLCVLWRIRI